MFYVYDIEVYLKNKGITSQLFVTKMPDVIFEVRGKKIALEIETGSMIDNAERIRKKSIRLKITNSINGFLL